MEHYEAMYPDDMVWSLSSVNLQSGWWCCMMKMPDLDDLDVFMQALQEWFEDPMVAQH